MKNSKSGSALTLIYRVLLALVICLALVLIGGTAYTLLFRHDSPAPVTISAQDGIFTGIGQLRLQAADSANGITDGSTDGPVVVLTVTFPYDPSDRAFAEELAARVNDFRTITGDYIHSFKSEDLKKMGEDQLKSGLLERYNGILRLGKIQTLYFSDFMFIE